jgi:hypothetical protein
MKRDFQSWKNDGLNWKKKPDGTIQESSNILKIKGTKVNYNYRISKILCFLNFKKQKFSLFPFFSKFNVFTTHSKKTQTSKNEATT